MADPQKQVLNFLGAFSDKPDFARLRACFSPDAYYQPLVPMLQTYRGRDAIINILRTQYQTYYDCRCEIHTIAANGRSVFYRAHQLRHSPRGRSPRRLSGLRGIRGGRNRPYHRLARILGHRRHFPPDEC
ncbi:nuclear transport factor 2 family protein [Sphingomonas solaris]|uniref:Nuclear transport factor 2 family protein n=1 Tax=Alterirhizorhabdus solaris TaxID=2529389 RepID=A0A558RCD3_9SPHN|nr:nuclear transport factor 2 family protein [Sphingomonas solaris]TVV77127.1 nuclear transport factor 2 family protein [Sphingomonas solaris]